MKDIFLLDMDATLLDFPAAETRNFRKTLAELGIENRGGMYARFHEINDGLWRLLERGGISREALKVERFRRLFEEFGLNADAGKASDLYFSNFPEICIPYPGAREFLAQLATWGRIFIVTNGGTAIQRRHIALAGFAPYLTDVFISEELGADKPSYAYVEKVTSRIAGFSPARAVLMGDSLTSDKVCAERMGVDFILYAAAPPEGYRGAYANGFGEALALISEM